MSSVIPSTPYHRVILTRMFHQRKDNKIHHSLNNWSVTSPSFPFPFSFPPPPPSFSLQFFSRSDIFHARLTDHNFLFLPLLVSRSDLISTIESSNEFRDTSHSSKGEQHSERTSHDFAVTCMTRRRNGAKAKTLPRRQHVAH